MGRFPGSVQMVGKWGEERRRRRKGKGREKEGERRRNIKQAREEK